MNQTKQRDSRLIDACKQHNAKAQMQLYDLYCKAMCSVAARYVEDRFLAEDIMQDAFISAFQKIETFKGEVSFGAWLKQIVIHKSLDWLKKKKLKLVALDAETPQDTTEESSWDFAEKSQVTPILKAIESLKERYRIVLSLYLIEGYDHQEIAEILGIEEVTSRSCLMRGKKKVRAILKKEKYAKIS